MGLDGSQRPTSLGGDLVEAQLAKEAEGDHFTVRLIESADRGLDACCALRPQRGDRGIETAGQVDAGRWIARVDPGDIAPALRTPERDADSDPRQPGPEWPVSAPAREASEGGHERLLGGVLGLVEIAENAVAGADDGGRLVLDEDPERVSIASQDGIDSGAFIDDLWVDDWR
jgi:hypothetical protein